MRIGWTARQASRWRVALRMAYRQTRRARGSSALIVVLILLPITAMAAYTVVSFSLVAEPAERVRAELGDTQAWVKPVGTPGAGFWQAPTQPDWTGYAVDDSGGWTIPEGDPLGSPVEALPAGTETIEVVTGTAAFRTATGRATLPTWAGAGLDPRLAGRFDLVDGVAPRDDDEAAVSPGARDRLGTDVGGTLTLADGSTFTVTAIVRPAGIADRDAAVLLPLAAAPALDVEDTRWYLPDLVLDWDAVQALNEDGIVAYSRTVVLEPPTRLRPEAEGSVQQWWSSASVTLGVLGIGGAFAAYVVAMLAGAAFAVSARRQQRTLAVAASVGAARADNLRLILLQGTVLGAAGGVAGSALGTAIGVLLTRLMDDGSRTSVWGLHVPWPILVGIAVFAVIVGTLSSLVPAFAVTGTDVLAALRGARRPRRPRANRPVWGSVLLVAGVAITLGSGLWLGAAALDTGLSGDSPARVLPTWGLVLGPVVTQVGFLVAGGWLLWLAARVLAPVGVAARVAARDAAASAGRSVPAFAAIGATVFLGVFAVALTAMSTAETVRQWQYTAPVGSAAVTFFSQTASGDADPSEAVAAAAAVLAENGADRQAVVSRQGGLYGYESVDDVPPDGVAAVAVLPDRYLLDPDEPSRASGDPRDNIAVVAPDDLSTALGGELDADVLAAYRAGGAVVTDRRYLDGGGILVSAWSARDSWEGRARDNVWQRRADAPEETSPVWSVRLPAVSVTVGPQPIGVAISPDTARDLGLETGPTSLVAAFDAPPSTEDRDRLSEAIARISGDTFASLWVESGPPSPLTWVVPLLGGMAVLVLGASTVALGLARFERRPDDATLAAIGAEPGLRRRIGFWQGLLLTGFGTLAGAVAGILPAAGLAMQSRGALRLEDAPWWLLVLVVVGLPLGTAVGGWVVAPRRPDLTRRTAIT